MSQSSMPLSFRVVPFKDEILDVWIDRLCSKFDVNRQWLFRHIGLPSELNSRDLSRGIYYGGRLDTIMTNDLINRLATFSGVDAIELARTIIKFDKMYLLPKIHMVYVLSNLLERLLRQKRAKIIE